MPALDSRRLLVLGRLHGLTRPRLRDIVQRAGGRVVESLGPGLDLVAVAHASAGPLFLDARLMDLLERVPGDAALVSEFTLKRRLGLMAPCAPEVRHFTAAALSRLSGLDEELLFWLALFDIVEPVDELYGYRDIVAARSVARLLEAGADFGEVLKAGVALHRDRLGLSQIRLVATPAGEILRELDGRASELDGQFRLALDEPRESADELFECAEAWAAAGDYGQAERCYGRALRLDPTDPVIPFRLGNILEAQDRALEAVMAWRTALARDPGFAEAWFRLGVAAEAARRFDEAAACFRRALDAEAGHIDAAYALALLLYLRGRFAEALPAWDRFLRLEPLGPRADLARRYATLCRLQARRIEAPAGHMAAALPERP
jgi:tetratricopeptide (TPR) repeat protein